jgi:hypothetical protein
LDQAAAAELGQDAGVDLVGLAGQRSHALDPLGIGDLVVDEPCSGHRLDGRAHRFAPARQPVDERAQTITIGRTPVTSTVSTI